MPADLKRREPVAGDRTTGRPRAISPTIVHMVPLRMAESDELSLLREIEQAAERMFADAGITFPPGPTVVEEAVEAGAEVYVAGEPPVGFAAVRERDGYTHLEQIAVRPELTRQGI